MVLFYNYTGDNFIGIFKRKIQEIATVLEFQLIFSQCLIVEHKVFTRDLSVGTEAVLCKSMKENGIWCPLENRSSREACLLKGHRKSI